MNGHSTKLHHEDLDSYQAAIELTALAASLLDDTPRGYAFLSDQLKRASLSIPLNIAEGYGKRTSKDRGRFYDIARGSAHECGAILDALRVLNLVDPDKLRNGKNLLHRTGFDARENERLKAASPTKTTTTRTRANNHERPATATATATTTATNTDNEPSVKTDPSTWLGTGENEKEIHRHLDSETPTSLRRNIHLPSKMRFP